MKKIIIPRGDHEVYFIKRPEGLKTKNLSSFVFEQLDRLHPGFSASSSVDVQQFVFNGAFWIMATVMEAETLADYKILNRGAAFYTATSIAARSKDFLLGGIKIIDGERIGFDAEKNEPVSVPVEEGKGNTSPFLSSAFKTIPPKYGVFAEKAPLRQIAAISAGVILLLLLPAVFIGNGTANGKKVDEAAPAVTRTEPEVETRYLPQALEILANISADIAGTNGKMTRWQYNEDSDPVLIIQTRGIDVLDAHRIFGKYEYLGLNDVQDILYSDGEPLLTLYVNAERTVYAQNTMGVFPSQGFILSTVTALTNDLQRQGVSIVSEMLPAPSNGNNSCAITYTANGLNLVPSLDVLDSYCDTHQLIIKRVDVSIAGDNERFNVSCSLARCGSISDSARGLAGSEKETIPLAFGFREKPPDAKLAAAAKAAPINEREPILGTIKDGGGRMLFYRDTSDGKIKVRGNP